MEQAPSEQSARAPAAAAFDRELASVEHFVSCPLLSAVAVFELCVWTLDLPNELSRPSALLRKHHTAANIFSRSTSVLQWETRGKDENSGLARTGQCGTQTTQRKI